MSGKDERPYTMPECGCENFKTWVILDGASRDSVLVWVNIDDYCRNRYGRWHFAFRKPKHMRGATGIQCNECGAIASPEYFARVIALFERERLGG